MSVLGEWLLVCAVFSSGASAAMYFRATSRGEAALLLPRRLLTLGVLFLSLTSALLLSLLLRHDFSNGYVFAYSDRSLPLHYLISTFYAGQAGSFLFWSFCAVLIGLLLRRHARRAKTEAWVMTVYMVMVTVFILLVIAKSPFQSVHEAFPGIPAGQVPADGRGLNPLLKNFWMVIHPPVLFIGFALLAAPFSLAIGGLWKKDYRILTATAFPWVLAATSVLGLGIMLGAYWAYGVLGWGGYWGWDPVENSSLVPWITGIALLHTMLAQLRTGRYVRTNFVLAGVTFLLVVYSTFLTRSGVLGDSSVHAFSDPGAVVYWLLIVAMALIGGATVIALGMRWKEMKPPPAETGILTRETSLGAASILLILSAAVILFGTSLPIFSVTGVEPTFYDSTHLPIGIAIGLLIGFSLYTQWEFQDMKDTLRRSAKSLGGSLLLVVLLFLLGMKNMLVLLFIFSSVFALLANAEIAIRVVRGNWRFLGGKITHAGMSLFLLGVICVGKFSSTERVSLRENSPVSALGHTITFRGITMAPGGGYVFHVEVADGARRYTLNPVMADAGQQGVMRTPDIATMLTRDFYVSPVQYGDEEAAAGQETYTLAKGQTIAISGVQATFVGFDMSRHEQTSSAGGGGMAVGSVLDLASGGEHERITPFSIYKGGRTPEPKPAASRLMNADIVLLDMSIGSGAAPSSVTVGVQRSGATRGASLIIDASVKPYINLLWGGTMVMMIGFFFSIVKRAKGN